MNKLVEKLKQIYGEANDIDNFLKHTKGKITLEVNFLMLSSAFPIGYSFIAERKETPFLKIFTKYNYTIRDRTIRTVGHMCRMSRKELLEYVTPKLKEQKEWLAKLSKRPIEVIYPIVD